MNSVLIFRTHILRQSETFIRGQAAAMRRFAPYFVGWKRVAGLEVPTGSSWVVNEGGLLGRVHELDFRLRGPSANCIAKLQKRSPKLIHAHFGTDACEALPLAAALGLPLVSTLHGYDVTTDDEAWKKMGWFGRRFLGARPKLQRTGSLFVVVSQFIKERALELGFPEDRVVVHYIGIDTDEFRPAEGPEGINREPLVLFVGRLVEKKGCAYLLKAMAGVQVALPKAKLLIIGDGPERNNLEQQAGELRLRAQFLGVQPPEVVKHWMRRARIFSVPSIRATNGDSEGFGMVFVEAQACGTPVVSFSSGGVPEAVAHGESGLLARERDCETLARHLIQLLKNEDLWLRFSHAGRQRVLRYFDIQRQTSELEDLYDQVLPAPQGSATAGRTLSSVYAAPA